MYLSRVDVYRQHTCFWNTWQGCSACVAETTLEKQVYIFKHINSCNIISSAYTFLTTLHASDLQGLLIAATPRATANWKRYQVKAVGVLGTIALKCQALSSTPDRYLKFVNLLCSYGTGYMLQHLFALKEDVGPWEATSHGYDFIYAVATKTMTIRP